MMKRAAAWLMALALVLCAGGCTTTNTELYERAQLYLGYGEYDMARELFQQLGEFRDSADYALYCAGIEALALGDTALAQADFTQVDPFKSSGRYLRYLDALALEESGELSAALEAMLALGSFADCTEHADSLRKAIPEQAMTHCRGLIAAGRYEQALTELRGLDGYGESAILMAECERAIRQTAYDQAMALYNEARFDDALAAFESLGDTLDAKARVLLCRSALYLQAEKAYAAVTLATAPDLIAQYESLADYLESPLRLADLHARFDVNLALAEVPGAHVLFGCYPVGESGAPEQLSWTLLSVEDGHALLLCDRVIDAMPLASVTDLRLTLTADETAASPMLSLPAMAELATLTEAPACPATAYAIAQGVQHHTNGCAWWWLRDVLPNGRQAVCWYNGTFLDTGVSPDEPTVGIRPMLRLSLDHFAFTQGAGTAASPYKR